MPRLVSLLVCALLVLGSFALALVAPPIARAASATTTTDTELRSGPGTVYPVVAVVPAGSALSLDGAPQTDYYPVTFNGTPGWVPGAVLNIVKDDPAVGGPAAVASAEPPPAAASTEELAPVDAAMPTQATGDAAAAQEAVTPVPEPATTDPAAATAPAEPTPTPQPVVAAGSGTVPPATVEPAPSAPPEGDDKGRDNNKRKQKDQPTEDPTAAAATATEPTAAATTTPAAATDVPTVATTGAPTAAPNEAATVAATESPTATPSPTPAPAVVAETPTPAVTASPVAATASATPTGAPTPTAQPTPAPGPTGPATATTAVNLRAGPSDNDAVLFLIPAGSTVTRTGQTVGEFVSVDYMGIDGWAAASYLAQPVPVATEEVSPAAPTADTRTPRPGSGVAFTTVEMSLRAGPSANEDALTVVPAGSKVILTGVMENGFQRVQYDDQLGWLANAYLSTPADPTPESDGRSSGRRDGDPSYSHDQIVKIIYDAADRYGQSRSDMLRVAQCESNLDPYAVNPSGSYGLYQFIRTTWKETPYGDEDVFDPKANANAAGWMWAQGRKSEWVCQ